MLAELLDLIVTKGALGKGALLDVKCTAAGGYRTVQPLTRRNVEVVLDWMECRVRFNMMQHRPVFSFRGVDFDDVDEPGAYQALCDVLGRLDIAAPRGALDEALTAIALGNRYHPMEDWLQGLVWDGVDRFDALAGSVVTDCELWPVYLENWLVQVVDGVCGWREPIRGGLPYCLVLVGAQGVGKTRWLRALGAGWLRSEAELQLSSAAGRDHQLEALRWPMVELAELDGVFRKSDVAHLKTFLSRETDALRAPYARRAVVTPRMTAFCASVNVGEFLTDSTGSRRFWPVDVGRTTIPDIAFSQLWAQAYAWWQESRDFHLTEREERIRAAAGAQHTVLSEEIEKLAAYWEAHRHCADMMRPMNRSEILNMLGFRHLSNRTIAEAGDFLIRELGKMRTLSGKQRAWEFPFSEFAHDSSTWQRAHLTIVK